MMSLLDAGRSRGHAVSVIAPEESAIHDACRQLGVRSDVAEFRMAPGHLRRLRTLFGELNPDVVHGMSVFPVAYLRRSGALPAERRVPCFAYVSTDPASTLPLTAKRFRRMLHAGRTSISRSEAPRLEAIFVPSHRIAEQLETLGIRGRTVVVSGAIDPVLLQAEAARPIGLPHGTPRVGYAGFLEPLKGIDNLIAAFAKIAEDHPEGLLLVAGEGPERVRLAELAATLGVADRVVLLGHLDPVAPLLASLDVFVSPSRTEALGRSILEAMALGVPVVCTDSGGPREFIRDTANGLLVPPDDPDALVAAIASVVDDPALARRLGAAGRDTAHEPQHLMATTVDTIFAEYERAAAAAGSSA
jgi:glycosyltransferase involved in cell wall biosynthesis